MWSMHYIPYASLPLYMILVLSRILVLCGLCIRIPIFVSAFFVSMRPDCNLCVRILDSMHPSPVPVCIVRIPMRPYSCLCMWVYASRIHLLCICVYTVVYVITAVRIPVMYADLCVRILVLCMWVCRWRVDPCPLVMHLWVYPGYEGVYVILCVPGSLLCMLDLSSVRILVSSVCMWVYASVSLVMQRLLSIRLHRIYVDSMRRIALLCMDPMRVPYSCHVFLSYVCGSASVSLLCICVYTVMRDL
ncbi:GJB6 [Acanthosepion pharaonis]|uniref:GJB6 n=1 Tax=Acanthosepion pharaonis TaxID=158019 RepID=A0A812BHG5_ACAPH|nr:GJB6 [Sepia pharaonis]